MYSEPKSYMDCNIALATGAMSNHLRSIKLAKEDSGPMLCHCDIYV